jgi:phosphohistidine phosphatase SixA
VSFSQSQNKEIKADETIYYFIRHAEKDRSSPKNRNPKLSKKGQLRALNWAYFFREIPLVAIYSTNYTRTITTAEPVAGDKNLPIIIYSPKEVDIKSFKKKNHGKLVLIVGHSNTTPEFVNAILGFEKFNKMKDNDNSSLFIIKEIKGDATIERLSINF